MKKSLPIQTLAILLFVTVTCAHAVEHHLDWARAMGGNNANCVGLSIVVDPLGNTYTTGYFVGTVDFDPGPDTFNISSKGYYDIFISKLDNNGEFVWAKTIGGNDSVKGQSIAMDNSGNIYITGYFAGTVDFDPGPDTFNLSGYHDYDIFIVKLDNNGEFVWAKAIGAQRYDYGLCIALDPSGNIYTTGYFGGTVDFDPGPATYNLTSADDYEYDIFISKLDNNGDFVWAKAIGSTGYDYGRDINFDSSGNIVITGAFEGTVDFDPGPDTFNLSSQSRFDIFISKLDSNGDFIWAKSIGGYDDDGPSGLYIDTSDNIYFTGTFYSNVDFNPGDETHILESNGFFDIFISKLDSNGNFVWAKAIGGPVDDYGFSLYLDTSGNIYVTGGFGGTVDFNPGDETYVIESNGEFDIFISKLDFNGNFIWAKAIGGPGYDIGADIVLDTPGNLYATGTFQYFVDFDPGPGTYNLGSSSLLQQTFVTRFTERFTVPPIDSIHPIPPAIFYLLH